LRWQAVCSGLPVLQRSQRRFERANGRPSLRWHAECSGLPVLQRSHSVGLNEWTVVHLGGQRGECVQRAVEHRKIAVDGLACLERSGGSIPCFWVVRRRWACRKRRTPNSRCATSCPPPRQRSRGGGWRGVRSWRQRLVPAATCPSIPPAVEAY